LRTPNTPEVDVTEALRIAMWSGPRNISTALMRSFGSRSDTVVVDEPFYAVYLARTGLDHPMREAVLRSQPQDWRTVVSQLFSPLPEGRSVHYQKHMTHHMLPELGREWLQRCCNAFLIRDPAAVLASYVQKRAAVSLHEIGLPQQYELFEQVSAALGRPAPVIDSDDVLADPAGVLAPLCEALGIAFQPAMLQWQPGRRDTDGVWAPAWYDAVEKSSGFGPASQRAVPELNANLRHLADEARRYYDALARYRITSRAT
jgi:hypothetical protein